MHAVVVGGSLAGLATTLALARAGVEVTLVERTGPHPRSGGAIGVNHDHLERVTGIPSADPGRTTSVPECWTRLQRRMRRAAVASELVRLTERTTVTDVRQDDGAVEVLAGTQVFRGDFAVLADGHRSVIRRAVDPEHPDAAFAGYVLWLGIARESDLPARGSWPTGADILDGRDAVLIGYPLEGEEGHRRPGSRRLGWAWFDPTRNELLHHTGAVRDHVVHHSLKPADIPAKTLNELDHTSAQWPEPWRAAIRWTISDRAVTGTPIAEYVPRKLVQGRIALVGNAAQVPTPMTGRGFDTSLDDAATLADAIRSADTESVATAVEIYERERLEPGRAMVTSGQSFGEWFGRR